MRILGIDFGTKWLGLALGDELGIAARGLGRLPYAGETQAIEKMREITTVQEVGRIVIGYPLREDGTKGTLCARVDRFADRLGAALRLPVVKWDETLSTAEAQEILKQRGLSWRESKKKVDELAAVLILQDYLNRGNTVRGERQE